ncbi:MAG: ABC transporter ATP-binding protein [Betaproteobacteria bacterium RIFCSPLOWO2_12_FULL_65_14]|nr:MAG: ABC transporter ATP-binding protein [Betaproteobacteria bacterium RIFCSPLOWO2_12_FULL_65_14]
MGVGPANEAVRIATLVKRYGRLEALKQVDLEVPAGEAFGLVGANGAGKTTLIKCMLDLCDYDAGTIELFGAGARAPAARRRLAYVPERFVPPHYLRCREFLALLLQISGMRYDAASAAALLAELELDAQALERPVRQLSKGMTQKLGLAAAFLLERDLYVLDEPMSGLDPAARVAVKSVLRRLAAEGRTLFFTSHVLADVEELCSSIAVLDNGSVRFRGPPAALCARYAETRLEQAFMRCIRER